MKIAPLDNRAIISLSGEDRQLFLQGLISNDVNLCTPCNAIYAAFMTPQGKFLHDLFVIHQNDHFLIDCEKNRLTDLIQRLNRHKLRAKINLTDQSNKLRVYAALEAFPPTEANTIAYKDPRLPELGWRLIATASITPNKISDFSLYDQHRLALGVADGSRDMIVDKSTLLEGNFDCLNGISWSKGCYMGQELTARTHYRGLIKKRIFPVKISGVAPTAGSPVFSDTTEVGEMRSSNGDNGLALLSIEKVIGSVSFKCAEATLQPLIPGWLKEALEAKQK